VLASPPTHAAAADRQIIIRWEVMGFFLPFLPLGLFTIHKFIAFFSLGFARQFFMLETLQIFIWNPGHPYETLVCNYKDLQQEEKKITVYQNFECYASFMLYSAKFPVCIVSLEYEGFHDDNDGQGYYCSLPGTYLLGSGNLVYLWPTCETLPGKFGLCNVPSVSTFRGLDLENISVQSDQGYKENDVEKVIQLCEEKLSASCLDTVKWLEVATFLNQNLCYLYHRFFVRHSEEEVVPFFESWDDEQRRTGERLIELLSKLGRFCLWITVTEASSVFDKWVDVERFGLLADDSLSSCWRKIANNDLTVQEDSALKCHECMNSLMVVCCLLSCELVQGEINLLGKISSFFPILLMGSLPLFPGPLRTRCLEQLAKISKEPRWVAELDEKMKRDYLFTLSITLENFRVISDEMKMMLIQTVYQLGRYTSMHEHFEMLCTSKLLRNIASYAKQKKNASLAACASVVCEFVLNHYEDSFGFLVEKASLRQAQDDLLTLSSYHRSVQLLCEQKRPQSLSEMDCFHEKFLVATLEQRKSLQAQNVIRCVPTEKRTSLEIWEPLLRDSRKWNSWLQNRTRMVRKLVMYGIPMRIRALVWRKLMMTDQMLRKYKGVFRRLLQSKRPKEVDDVIERDIVRTLPSHNMFWSFGAAPGIDSLRSILSAYAALVPQVGYCQGMSSIAAMILLFSCDVEEAFLNFVYMMDTLGFHDLFYPGFTALKTRVAEFHGIALFYFPQLMKHLSVEGIHPMMFADKWFLTAFVYNFPFSLAVRLWDIMLTYRHNKIVMRAGLAILELGKERMMQMQFEELIQFVQKGFADPVSGVVGDVDNFIEKAMAFRFKRKRATALAKRSDIMEQVDVRQRTILGCFPSSPQTSTKYSQTRPLEMLDKWVTERSS